MTNVFNKSSAGLLWPCLLSAAPATVSAQSYHGLPYGGRSHLGVVALVAAAFFFLPTWIALWRGHQHKVRIFGLNLVLGITVVGWLAAFVWSLTRLKPKKALMVEEPVAYARPSSRPYSS